MRKILLLLLFTCFVVPTVMAQPSTIVSIGTDDLEIKYPLFSAIRQNADYEFEFHVYNKSNGIPMIGNLTCYFHLYNASGNHLVIMDTTVVTDTFDYAFEVDGENFTAAGPMSYVIQCNNTDRGGFAEVYFEITQDGLEHDPDTGTALILVGTLLLFVALGIKTESKPLKLLFTFISLFIAITAINTAMTWTMGSTLISMTIAYQLVMWTSVFTLLFTVIMLIKGVFSKKTEDKKREMEEDNAI